MKHFCEFSKWCIHNKSFNYIKIALDITILTYSVFATVYFIRKF